jgi:3-hydroxybutyryl-CoA dehydrogenase
MNILVVGAGTMGAGIAQIAAAAGNRVTVYDENPETPLRAKERIAASLARAEAKGHVTTESAALTLENLHPTSCLDQAADAAVVVEAVTENIEIKRSVFLRLEQIVKSDTSLWTNTSMLSISAIGAPLARPERFCGVHFFNPVPRMRLVEVIAGKKTSSETIDLAVSHVKRWGKTAVYAPDTPGFIVNRVLDGIKREALDLLDLGVPPDQIDTAVKLGLNFPMGPLELMDLIGLDTTLDVLVNQAHALGRPSAKITRLHELVAAGNLGRKTGKGFYTYPQE